MYINIFIKLLDIKITPKSLHVFLKDLLDKVGIKYQSMCDILLLYFY